MVSDLDGTLLDDHYDLRGAAQALNALVASSFDVRLVALASSKTLTEMLLLADECDHPPVLIFENGAGRAVPMTSLPEGFAGARIHSEGNIEYGLQIYGAVYEQICEQLGQLRAEHGYVFTGFADMDRKALSGLTGLSLSAAELAQQRSASEPLLWEGSDAEYEAFVAHLAQKNLEIVAGGRFLHVSSGHDKATSFAECVRLYAPDARVLACGDAPNDRALLDEADHALVFPDRLGGYLSPVSATTSHSPAAGGRDWLRSVLAVLTSYQKT